MFGNEFLTSRSQKHVQQVNILLYNIIVTAITVFNKKKKSSKN